MTDRAGEDTDPLRELATQFNIGYVGHTICVAIDELRSEIDQRLVRITKLVPYLSGMYFSDQQRRMAEAEIFRLKTEVNELTEELNRTLVMAPDLGYPLTINT